MSTNARIGLLLDDDIVSSVYVHFDGYPDYTGEMLYKYYNTKEKVKELLSYGNIKQLHRNVDESKFFTDDVVDIVLSTLDQFEEYMDTSYIRYLYLFKDGKWLVNSKNFD